MPTTSHEKRARKRRHTRRKDEPCSCCGKVTPFNWTCRCGFNICQACMQENFWTMSCNGITWLCPECEGMNGFGNQ